MSDLQINLYNKEIDTKVKETVTICPTGDKRTAEPWKYQLSGFSELGHTLPLRIPVKLQPMPSQNLWHSNIQRSREGGVGCLHTVFDPGKHYCIQFLLLRPLPELHLP